MRDLRIGHEILPHAPARLDIVSQERGFDGGAGVGSLVVHDQSVGLPDGYVSCNFRWQSS